MATSCVELFVKFAVGIGVMKEFHRPSGGDLEANGANNGTGKDFHTSRIEIVPSFFFLIDILDVALDIIFSSQLVMMGQPGFGALMVIMTAISVSIWFWSRSLIRQAINSEFSTSTIRIVMCFSEMAMFFIQDATTIFIFTRVPESYEGNLSSAINLVITIICGASLVLFQVYLSFKKEGGCRRCRGENALHFLFFLCNMTFLTTTLVFAIHITLSKLYSDTRLSQIYGIPCGYWLLFTLGNWIVMNKEENRDKGEEFWSKMGLELLLCE